MTLETIICLIIIIKVFKFIKRRIRARRLPPPRTHANVHGMILNTEKGLDLSYLMIRNAKGSHGPLPMEELIKKRR